MTPGVGLHLLIDGSTAWPLDRYMLLSYIRNVAREIQMTILDGYPDAADLPEGVQATAIIAESHITVVALKNGAIYIDVFSCKYFPSDIPGRMAVYRLGLWEGYTARVLERAGTVPPAP